MPSCQLTATFCDALLAMPRAGKTVNYFDAEIKGFMLEARATGGSTFYFRYRDMAAMVRMFRIGDAKAISIQDARAVAHKASKLVAEGGDPKLESHRFKDTPTLLQFVTDRYLPYVQLRKKSWTTDEVLLRLHLLPALGASRMTRITRSDVVALQQQLVVNAYAPATVNRIVILLKHVFNCALRWDCLPPGCNPCVGVKEIKNHATMERYLTSDEVTRLFAEIDSNANTQVGNVVRLLLYTGARKSEVLHATWDNVDLSRRVLTVPVSKSGRPRYIALSEAAVELLNSLPREEGMPWVFFNPKTRKPPVSFFYAWDTMRKNVGLADVRLHDLRHSFASFLVNSGRTLYEVQRLLGHHDPKVTMRYAHLSQDSLLEAVDSMHNLNFKPTAVVQQRRNVAVNLSAGVCP
jgi:integrase